MISSDDNAGVGHSSGALRGLHAKDYLQDYGQNTTTWLGSANLTHAAFSTNVELLVRLTGPTKLVGYDCVLNAEKPGTLWDLLEEHPLSEPSAEEPEADETTELENHACEIASRPITVTLTGESPDRTAELTIGRTGLPASVRISANLFTLPDDQRELSDGQATWTGLGPTHIAPFVILHLSLEEGRVSVLVRANLIGDDEDRRGVAMATAIADREGFMRYLAALLGLPVALVADGAGEGTYTPGQDLTVVVNSLDDFNRADGIYSGKP